MLGILLIDKPLGLTSHDVVHRVRRKLGIKRVGHAGTLDPLASGLLIVAVGPATRFLQYLPLEPKTYVAEFEFGTATATYDAEGEVTAKEPVPSNLQQCIRQHLSDFLGEIRQLPPMYSAVKKDGKALYEYARSGMEVERKERNVFISKFEPISSKGQVWKFEIVCSGGTYIRSLAHDLGQAVGCGAYVKSLMRTDVGRFHLGDAVNLDSVEPGDILSLKQALPPLPFVSLNETQTQYVREGRAIQSDQSPDSPFAALLDDQGHVFSVARVQGPMLQPDCVIPQEMM